MRFYLKKMQNNLLTLALIALLFVVMLFNFMGVFNRLDHLLEESNRTRHEVGRLVEK